MPEDRPDAFLATDVPAAPDAGDVAKRVATSGELAAGTRVGAFEVVRMLGRGGFGAVYEGIDREIDKRVAIKVLHDKHADNPDILRRFRDEARAVNRIAHRNIVEVFQFGQLDDGRWYYVMDLLRGRSLEERRKQGAIPPDEALRVLGDVAHALDAAHAAGVVHRDVKPDNIFLGDDGSVRLLDFGIARTRDAAGSQTAVVGTPLYMAPEQYEGRGITGAADVYALGATAYHVLAGHPPLAAETPLAMMRMHLVEKPAPPSTYLRALAPADASLLAMLEKEPAKRPASARAAIEAVRRALAEPAASGSSPPVVVPEEPPAGRARWPIAALAAGVVVAVAAAIMLFMPGSRRSGARPDARTTADAAVADAATIDARAPTPPPGMAWLPAIDATIGTDAAEIDAVRATCRLPVCAELDRIDVWHREIPARRAKVAGFFIDVAEVTAGDFVAWLAAQPGLGHDAHELTLDGTAVASLGGPFVWKRAPIARGGSDTAASDVTWEGARRYCEAGGGRLPSANEWERAARGDRGARFPWGDDPPAGPDAVIARETGEASVPKPKGRGAKDRTPEGVVDLVGNVSEWTATPGAEPGTHEVRGGSFGSLWQQARSAVRIFQDGAREDIGFRCARDAPL